MKLSDAERTLLNQLQSDSAQSLARLAERSGLATSTVWRKIQDFEATGLIRGRVAVLDPSLAGVGLCAFATVRLADHSEEAISSFSRLVRTQPNIMEAHAISGAADYILKIRCADMAEYEAFLTRNLLRRDEVKSVVTSFSLKPLKETLAVPL